MIIGIREIEKAGREGMLKKVIVASNCPAEFRKRIENLDVEVEESNMDEKELAVKFGKPFPVSAVGIERDGE